MNNASTELSVRDLASLRSARKDNARLAKRNRGLQARTRVLAAGNRRLESEVTRRQRAEEVVRTGKERYEKLFRESQIMQKKLQELTREIIYAQEEERREISRELHDEVVQTLVGINVHLSALSNETSFGAREFRAKIARTQRLVEHSVRAVHRFARDLRPAALDDLGLIPALHAYSKYLAVQKKLKIRMTAFAGVEALAGSKRLVLYRVAQEALTNVGRHAQAAEVAIIISEIPGAVRMEINDDGKSFEVEKILLAKNHRRLGLIGMKERIEMIGGIFSIVSEPGRGTTVCAEIPNGLRKAAA